MDTKFHEAFKKAIHDSFNIICPCHNKNPIKIYNITSWVSNYFLRFIHWDVLATMLYKRVVNKFQRIHLISSPQLQMVRQKFSSLNCF